VNESMNASRYDYMHADDHHGHSHGRARSAFDRGAINNWYAPHHDSSRTGRSIAQPLLRWVATVCAMQHRVLDGKQCGHEPVVRALRSTRQRWPRSRPQPCVARRNNCNGKTLGYGNLKYFTFVASILVYSCGPMRISPSGPKMHVCL